MLEQVDFSKTISKDDYKSRVKPLREKLSGLQHSVKQSGLKVMVLLEGWSTAGKGSILADLLIDLDPRNFSATSTLPPSAEEQRRPFLWRHWNTLPANGYIALYDKAWYPEVVNGFVAGEVRHKAFLHRLSAINTFERQMADDGTLVLKFFLHITQKEQKKRLDKLAAKKSTAWRVEKDDYKANKNYGRYCKAYEEMLAETNTPQAPWHVVPGHDRCGALIDIYTVITQQIEAALAAKAASAQNGPAAGALSGGSFTLLRMPSLAEVPLGVALEEKEYRAELKKAQARLKKLHNHIYLHKIPVVIAYEGWDAAGKGGNIKRLSAALDPRGYEVVPIASPTPPEKNRQFLWRFWTQLPKDGHITIFDRTWYGRVMVERVEGFAKDDEWRRAYREINEFERELADWGAVLIKFWLHIDKDEQLRRFEDRQNTPEKQWKITEEDWRNREKWDAYEEAVNDMLRLTSTDFAPWTIVESQNKRYGRIKALRTVIEAIEARL